MRKDVLIVGSGGREHAIAWKVSQSPLVRNIFVAPGNGGTRMWNVPIQATDIDSLCNFAEKQDCLTIVGPEAPLELGLVNHFRKKGLPVFGPTKEQARLESSKAFSKEFMLDNGLPTAKFKTFSNPEQAIDYSDSMEGNIVVKADGLASGKGVMVCSNREEARNAVRTIMVEKAFGKAGNVVIVEEKLSGSEVSVMAMCDGSDAMFLGTAVDHKRLLDGDRGPNTGGMGAYSPAAGLPEEVLEVVMEKIVKPTVRKTGFTGFLYTGLMMTAEGPMILEFNARFGDPEAQAILPRLESDILDPVMSACYEGSLGGSSSPKWSNLNTCSVIMCSAGYPLHVKTGAEIKGLKFVDSENGIFVFHSGTRFQDGRPYTSGGRVICVTGMASSLEGASGIAYAAVGKIHWEGENHRTDIGRARNEVP